ncbi:hypothetical protein OSB04_003218 [Centaurea solstitialis]|uniref:Uncharacterized protein n=1 Tax=Centaurea solstitialis TaxID=347529 RepID=A0AA38UBR6_9ASTR|nr:hypothetical protein OSB04_003218 [Centaurea solstitialis]
MDKMQTITFKDTQSLRNIITNPMTKKTTLTQWLHSNQIDDRGRHLTYLDYISDYKWDIKLDVKPLMILRQLTMWYTNISFSIWKIRFTW